MTRSLRTGSDPTAFPRELNRPTVRPQVRTICATPAAYLPLQARYSASSSADQPLGRGTRPDAGPEDDPGAPPFPPVPPPPPSSLASLFRTRPLRTEASLALRRPSAAASAAAYRSRSSDLCPSVVGPVNRVGIVLDPPDRRPPEEDEEEEEEEEEGVRERPWRRRRPWRRSQEEEAQEAQEEEETSHRPWSCAAWRPARRRAP